MKRLFTLVAVVSLLMIGCGNDDLSSSLAQPDTGAAADTRTDDTTTDVSGSDAGDTGGSADGEANAVDDLVAGLDFGNGAARVTVGDVVYEFVLGGSETADGTTFIGSCQELFGLISGNGFTPGDPNTTIEFDIPPTDWESYEDGRFDGSAPRIEIELGDDGGWAADVDWSRNNPELQGQTQIDEWTLDNAVAVGTATFIEMEPWSAPVQGATPVQGSFEIGCASR